MSKRVRLTLGALISIAAVATFLSVSFMAATAHANLRRPAPPPTSVGQQGAVCGGPRQGVGCPGTPDPNTFSVAAFDVSEPSSENGTGAGDNIVHLINPTSANGTLCAMIYVFDDDEEPGECCGCPLSPNKLLSLSVIRDLTSNWEVTGTDNDNGLIKIISAVPNNANTPLHPQACNSAMGCNGGCDPTFEYAPTPALVGSVLRESIIANQGVKTLNETNMFQEGEPELSEITNLATDCAFFVANGSGHGICDCGPEDETANRLP